jgi:predicted aspartyl protease
MHGSNFGRKLAALFSALGFVGSATAIEPFGESVPMQQRASGNYYVAGTLSGGVLTDFLVDTGSGYVSLAPAVFERLRAAPGTVFLRDIVGSMANGRTLKVPVYRIGTLELSPQCVLHDVEITVMPGSTRNILGLSALRRVAPFALDLEPARLMLSGCDQGVMSVSAGGGAGGAGGAAIGPSTFAQSPAERASADLARQ